MKIIPVIILTLISLLLFYLYFYLGFYKDVKNLGVVEEEFYLLSQPHQGPYHKINDVITEVETWARNAKLSCKHTFGLYLDDPTMAEENRLRSEGGCISKNDIFSSLNIDHPKIHILNLNRKKYLKYEFAGSPAIGPFKVYPLAEKWFQETKYSRGKSVLEVYEVSGSDLITTYYFPIEN